MAERAGWWRAVRRNCGHKAKRRSVASIPAVWSSWRTSWSVPHKASPPQCRLGWRSLDKNTSRASGGRTSCAPIHSRVRTFPKIKCTQTNRRPSHEIDRRIAAEQAPAPVLVELKRPRDARSEVRQIDSRRLCGHFPSNRRALSAADEGSVSDDFRKARRPVGRRATRLTATSSIGRTGRARPRRATIRTSAAG